VRNKGGGNFFCGHLAVVYSNRSFSNNSKRKRKKKSKPAFSIFYTGNLEKLLFIQKALCPFKISFFAYSSETSKLSFLKISGNATESPPNDQTESQTIKQTNIQKTFFATVGYSRRAF
jgi:hypothetical protein